MLRFLLSGVLEFQAVSEGCFHVAPEMGVLGGSPGHCFHFTVRMPSPITGPRVRAEKWGGTVR